ncbi:MAG: hypothetical protein WCJ09_20190 [Planctomycetota bacterium]
MFFGVVAGHKITEITRAVWSFPQLDGPYFGQRCEPDQKVRFDLTDYGSDGVVAHYGIFRTWDGYEAPFAQYIVVDDDGLWIYAGTPVGGLPTVWDVGAYPLDDGKPTLWLPPLVQQLGELTEHVHRCCPIKVATYGWLTLLDVDIVMKVVAGQIPDERWFGIRIWNGSDSRYFPPNHTESPLRLDLPID